MLKKHYLKTINPLVLIIDAGTTNVKVFLIDEGLNILDKKIIRLKKKNSKNGWVEQNPEEIFLAVVNLLQEIIKRNKNQLKQIIGLGITNQRQWERQN